MLLIKLTDSNAESIIGIAIISILVVALFAVFYLLLLAADVHFPKSNSRKRFCNIAKSIIDGRVTNRNDLNHIYRNRPNYYYNSFYDFLSRFK